MSTPVAIWEFAWDDQNQEKLYWHGILVADVEALLDGRRVKIRRNKNHRSAIYKVIGQDRSGRLITVCVEPVSVREGIWRPVTGWPSNESEKNSWGGQ